MKILAILTLSVLAALPAVAQTIAPHATPFDVFLYQPAAEVEALTKLTNGRTASKIVIDHETYFIEYVTRGINTAPEAHGHWYDYIHVLSGEGSITYGGTQDGATDSGQLEMRGGKLVGGKTQILRPGDRLVIPPGLPHLFTATPGNTFTYLIFKQRV